MIDSQIELHLQKKKKKNCSCLAIANQDGHKNHNGKTTAVLVLHSFLLVMSIGKTRLG